MPSTLQISLPEFRGVTRRLVVVNLAAFFVLLLLTLAQPAAFRFVLEHLGFYPERFLSWELWQPFTYSLLQFGILGTLFDLVMLWFMGSLLEDWHGGQWLFQVYAASVLGGAATALMASVAWRLMGHAYPVAGLVGIGYGLFGLLAVIGILHGDVPFRLFFLIVIKARYLAIIAALIALATVFSTSPVNSISLLGAGFFAILFIRLAPRRGIAFQMSEGWYGFRNRYYRWKRRRAASKFEVYMKKQGRTVRFDGQGHLIDEDDVKHQDRKRWN